MPIDPSLRRTSQTNSNAYAQSTQTTHYRPSARKQPEQTYHYTINTTSGKRYTLDQNRANWIINRWKRDGADSYGYDDDDQMAKRNGQMSAAMRGTYKNSQVDRDLFSMGLPSEKYLERYMEDYDRWHTGDISKVFGNNVPDDDWTGMKRMYQQSFRYENTPEDQARKRQGLVPLSQLDKYTDTELDDDLLSKGLPPMAELGKYAGMYNNYKGVDNLYKNAALAYTRVRATQDVNGKFIQNDNNSYTVMDPTTGQTTTKTGKQWYAKSFYEELGRTNEDGSFVYGDIIPLLKKSRSESEDDDYVDPTKSFIEQMDEQFAAYGKADDNEDDFLNHQAFSYDDFVKNYDSYYEKYIKGLQANEQGQTVGELMDILARDSDPEVVQEYYTIDNSWFGDDGIGSFVDKYEEDYPSNTPYDMFSDMYKNGVSHINVLRAMRTVIENAAKKTGSNNDFYAISAAQAQAERDWAHTDELDALYGPDGYDVVKGRVIPKGASAPVEGEPPKEEATSTFNFGDVFSNVSRNYDTSAEAARAEQRSLRKSNRQPSEAEPVDEEFLEKVRDAITVYDSAAKAYEDTAGPGAPSEASREPINKANELLKSLGFKSIHSARRYVDSVAKDEEEDEAKRKAVGDALKAYDSAKADAGLAGDAKSAQAVIDAEKKVTSLLGVNSAEDAREWLRTGELPGELSANDSAVGVDDAIRIVQTYMEQNGGWNKAVATDAFNKLYDMNVSPEVIQQAAAEMNERFGDMEETFTEKEKKSVEELEADAQKAIDAGMELDANEATIDDTKNAILRALFDEDGNDLVATDVDSVIKLLDDVASANYTNPAAYQKALEDLGFGGKLSGVADDLAHGWSAADKNKLLYHLGMAKLEDVSAGFLFGDSWAATDQLQDMPKLDTEKFQHALKWANQEIMAGRLSEYEAYNILAAKGFQDEMEEYMPEEWHKAHFKAVVVPQEAGTSTGLNQLTWEEMTPEQRDAMAEELWAKMTPEEKAARYGNTNWWKYDPSVYRTGGQALEQQLLAVLPGFATNIMSGGVKLLDAIDAVMTGRPEMWDATQNLMQVEEGLSRYGSVQDNVNGSKISSVAADALQEILRMETLGSIGSIVGGAFAGTAVGSALTKAARASSSSKVVKKAANMFLGMVGSSPFVVSAFASNYAEAKQAGATNNEAAWYGMITGLAEGVLEGFEFDNLWGKALGQNRFGKQLLDGKNTFLRELGIVGKARLASIAASGLGEFTEESIGYVLETFLKMRHSDTWGKGTEWSKEDWLDQAMMGFITGALGGGIHTLGSINKQTLIRDYAMSDKAVMRQVFPDVYTATEIAESLPESVLDTYREGGPKVMSLSAYRQFGLTLESCLDNAKKQVTTFNDEKAKVDTKLANRLRELDGYASKAVSIDASKGSGAKELANLVSSKLGIELDASKPLMPQVKAAFKAEVERATSDHDKAVADLRTTTENALRNSESELKNLQKQLQEHYVGIYLMSEQGIMLKNPDWVLSNMAQAYMNGATVTKESLAQQTEAANTTQTKLAEAEATETIEEAKETAEAPENTAVKARELAYDRVYKDHEAGKAYAEEGGKNDSKLTPVEFAENERQNFQAKTTARLRRVTLELAGLEAKEGMSAKEIFDEAKKVMTPEAAQKLDMYQKLSKALGLNMVVRDVVAGTSGYVHDGKLYVTLNGKQSMLRVAAHELTHYMKGHAETQYDALRTSLVNEVGQEKFDEMLADKAQEYGLDLNDAKARLEADDEVCAELCEKMLENKDALERFVQSDLDAAKTLKQRLAKTLVAIKSAIRSIGTSDAQTKADLIKQQDTIEQWYKGLSDAIDNANKANGKTSTATETATVTETTTEAQPQAPPVETNPDLFMGEESARREQLRSDLEALAKKGTKVNGLSYQEVNDVLDRVLFGDKSNYNKADLAQVRGMLAQLIPEVTAYVNGDASVDANALNERLSAAIDYMLERYGEGSENYYNLRDLIPSKIALTDTAYKDLRAKDMTLRQASNELTKALGGKFVNFVYKKSPSYNNAMTIDELWQTITDQYGEQNGVGNIGEDALALIDYVNERNSTSSFDDLYGSQREDVVNAQVGEFLDAVQEMGEARNAETTALHKLDDDYMPLAEKYDAGIATEEDTEELRKDVDKAARDNGYTIKAYHGTTEDFTEFKRGTQGQNHDGYLEFGGGFYFTPNADEAREWVSRGRSGMSGKAAPRVMSVYLNPGRILGADDAVPGGARFLRSMWLSEADANFIANRTYRFINYLTEERGFSNTEVQDTLKALGFDAIDATFGQGKSGQYVVFDPEQIKSADLVTYDKDGDIIPLPERFNPQNNDIRWSLGDDLADLVNQYGAIEQGREPRARDVQVPRQVDDQTRVSKLIRSGLESATMTDATAEEVKGELVSDIEEIRRRYSYIPKSNDETLRKARDYISRVGISEARRVLHNDSISGNFNLNMEAVGMQLLWDAAERGDQQAVKELYIDLRPYATEAGQRAQLFNMLKEMKGVGSAWYVENLVKDLNTKYADDIATGAIDRPITVSEDAMNQLRAAKTQVEVDAAEGVVATELAAQLPLTWDEKLSNWRYLSMLGNPITHVRNFTGNKLMYGMGGMKDVVASGVQRILEKTGVTDESDRAHARLTSADKSYWDDFAQKSYEEQRSNLQGGGKLGFQSLLQQNKRSFDNKVLDAIARGKNPGVVSEKGRVAGLFENIKNNGAMGMLEVADAWGLEDNYKRALTEYMKAQGYSLKDGKVGKTGKDGTFTEISPEAMNKAIEWASGQAWTNTFRGPSKLATELNKISKMNPVAKLVVEGVLPFKKTPFNIAKQGFWYSPAGLVTGTVELLTKVKQGKMSAATAVDHLSSGLTGTALMALGVVLAKAGILRGGGEDKKKLETYLEDTGDQTYAFKFGNVSINMSAIAPATIPLFMGVALQEMLSRNGEDEGVDLSTITDVLAGTLNPFMEMSFMSSLNSALKNYNNEGIGGALGSTILTAAQNYGSQYLPTLGGKVAQFIDPTQRTTKSSATSPVGGNMDYYWRSLVKKVPGAEATLQPDVNVWGQTNTKDSFGDWALDFANKFILPTNIKVTNRDAVDNELIRVVESTGNADFLPSDGAKYFKVKGETYKMNASQYTEYSKERGQAAYAAIKELMQSPSYINATDETKAEMLKKALDAAYKTVNNIWKDRLGAFNH